jgi:hypothetical protein
VDPSLLGSPKAFQSAGRPVDTGVVELFALRALGLRPNARGLSRQSPGAGFAPAGGTSSATEQALISKAPGPLALSPEI